MKTATCSDCSASSIPVLAATPAWGRRDFLKSASAAALASAALPGIGRAAAAPAETLVTQLYKSLDEKQRGTLCFPWEHELRSKVDNNWMITKPSIELSLKKDQQALVREIFMGLHSEEYAKRVFDQVVSDGEGAEFEDSTAIALFGEPGTGKFEFVLTGRHCTRRCDGGSLAGTAFGGPIFYGHAAESFNETAEHPGNAYWFQAKEANKAFSMLDGRQRGLALLSGASRGETGTKTVALTGKKSGLPGIPMTELTSDQKDEVRRVLGACLAPFRKADADESLRLVEAAGFDHLHMAFYKDENIGHDEVWDVWQIEGPQMLWYFRGKPHVHAWAHIKSPA